jgi:GNAT superfamily N-acetyltransferase
VSFTIRPAEPGDVTAMLELVRELAVYEREPDAVEMTADGLTTALFGPGTKLFGHVAVDERHDNADSTGGAVVGMAVWFLNFSTWRGVHGIYLEDLVVGQPHRRRGIGKALLVTLAHECVVRGYARLEWAVLDWNTPAIEFYRSLGAEPLDEWTTYRLTGPALAALGGP